MNANLKQMKELGLAGALGAVFGLYLFVELVQTDSIWLRDVLAGVAIGGSIGFFLNGSTPLRDSAYLGFSRAASLGTLAGAVGGAVGLLVGELILGTFQGGLVGRAVSWSVLGLGIGTSQGVASKSGAKLTFGVIGGTIGGFVGGFLFEAIRDLFGNRYDLGQGLGAVVLGAGLGICLALVEQVLRRAWIEVKSGRQEGRTYLIDHKSCTLGLDEHVEIGLFGDLSVARKHAMIESTATGYYLKNESVSGETRVNGGPIQGPKLLVNGDMIELGKTRLVFRSR